MADTPQAATGKKAEETGRFITAAEGLKIAGVAKLWADADTPYAPRFDILPALKDGEDVNNLWIPNWGSTWGSGSNGADN